MRPWADIFGKILSHKDSVAWFLVIRYKSLHWNTTTRNKRPTKNLYFALCRNLVHNLKRSVLRAKFWGEDADLASCGYIVVSQGLVLTAVCALYPAREKAKKDAQKRIWEANRRKENDFRDAVRSMNSIFEEYEHWMLSAQGLFIHESELDTQLQYLNRI